MTSVSVICSYGSLMGLPSPVALQLEASAAVAVAASRWPSIWSTSMGISSRPILPVGDDEAGRSARAVGYCGALGGATMGPVLLVLGDVGAAAGHVMVSQSPWFPQFAMATNSASQLPHSGQASMAEHV